MPPNEANVLQLLVNFGIYADEKFAPLVRLKAFELTIETALNLEMFLRKACV